ncbi:MULTISPECIES: hypothetical protein [Aerococcus]|uniref:hypothetical protein n=1 Tax=Aerococcus TaxID=1375 RepID=UPI000DCD80C2|nr:MULTISPECIES: hypothetical protein [Aerococcus]KAA9298810.1 hypothetical protein F6I08_04410 [Aerococcus tenax]MDK6688769.1 hypothetical protein [Aerococcus urinae]MDK8132954.1 hypothetical protein [Aerococcus urinae]MDK8484608.1 hypothetical protein [Aerococcus urinae]MDL5179455.1 hypothetical protein [Aerococcus tenax]
MNDKDRKEFEAPVRSIITALESIALVIILYIYASITSQFEAYINFKSSMALTFLCISITYGFYFYQIRLKSDHVIPHNLNSKVISTNMRIFIIIIAVILSSLPDFFSSVIFPSSQNATDIWFLEQILTLLISISLIFIFKQISLKDSTLIKKINHSSYKFSKLELSLFSLLVIPYLLLVLDKGSFDLKNNNINLENIEKDKIVKVEKMQKELSLHKERDTFYIIYPINNDLIRVNSIQNSNPVVQSFYMYFFLYILCILTMKVGRFIALLLYWKQCSTNDSTQLSNKNSHISESKIFYNEFFLIDLDK